MDLCSRDKGRARKILAGSGISARKVDQTIDLCLRLPSIDAKATVETTKGDAKNKTVHVTLKRVGPKCGSKAPKSYTPRFPKVKEEGWWIVIGDSANDELLALRRISFGDRASVKLKCPPSSSPSARTPKLVVYLMSDSYIGLDQEISLNSKSFVEVSDDEFDDDDDTFWILPPREIEPFWLGEGENAILT